MRSAWIGIVLSCVVASAQVWKPVGSPSAVSDATGTGLQDYGKVSGRALAVAVDPSDSSGNTVYVGTVGGLWRTTNGAAVDAKTVAWSPLTDAQASLVAGAVAVKPDDPNTIVVGTGEGDGSANALYGRGLLVSGDRGATWTNVTSAGAAQLTGAGFTSIAYSTDVTSVVVASVAASAYASWFPNAYRGLIYSADGGHSWAQASVTDTGATVAGASATHVIYNRFTHKFYAALRYHGLYESSDGANFTRMQVQPFAGLTKTIRWYLGNQAWCNSVRTGEYRAWMEKQYT